MSTTSSSSLFSSETVRDIFLWRRKKKSLLVLLVSTATWVLLDAYQFNFITAVSWVAMFIVTLLFLYGNLVRLFRKEEPNLSGLEISEEQAVETANSVRELIGGGSRWMFSVSAERGLFTFALVVAGLWLLSYVGSFIDLLTLLYIGIVMAMTVPSIYVKNEDKIRSCAMWIKMQARRTCDMLDEKVLGKIKNKVVQVKERKEKKVE